MLRSTLLNRTPPLKVNKRPITSPTVLGGLDPLVVGAAPVPLPRGPPPSPELLGGLPLGRHGPSLAPAFVVKLFLEVHLGLPVHEAPRKWNIPRTFREHSKAVHQMIYHRIISYQV